MAIGAILGAAVSAIPAIMQLFEGSNQRKKGKEGLASLERPSYEVPESIQRATALSEQAYADPYMPGEGMMLDRTGLSAANALEQATMMGDGLGAVSSIQANQDVAERKIGVASSQRQLQDMQQLQAMLRTLASFQDTEFQMNEFAPFAEKSQEYRDMYGAGMKNQFAGVKGLSNVGSALVSQIGMDYDTTSETQEIDYDMIARILEQNKGGATNIEVGQDGSFDPYGWRDK